MSPTITTGVLEVVLAITAIKAPTDPAAGVTKPRRIAPLTNGAQR